MLADKHRRQEPQMNTDGSWFLVPGSWFVVSLWLVGFWCLGVLVVSPRRSLFRFSQRTALDAPKRDAMLSA
jgi:hypothetical protein